MSQRLQDRIVRAAERAPNDPAIVAHDEQCTYGEVDVLSTQFARALLENGVCRGDRVGVYMPKCISALASVIGVLKADCVYVPLSTDCPSKRVQQMLAICEPSWIVTSAKTAGQLGKVIATSRCSQSVRIAIIDEGPSVPADIPVSLWRSDLSAFSAEPLTPRASLSEPALILFTSGSTGRPKGVAITQQNVITFVDWATAYFGMHRDDRISCHPPLDFDLATFDMFSAFSVGAELHLIPPEIGLFPQDLVRFIQDHRLTQWFSVPSILSHWMQFEAVEYHGFPHLRRLLWAGEVLPTRTLSYLMQRLPHVQFTNIYGPTETSIGSSVYTVPRVPSSDVEPIPIGTPCAGDQFLLLDNELQLVPRGELGEIFITGPGVTPGYWNDPEMTATAYLPNPHGSGDTGRMYRTGDFAKLGEDGRYYFHGRQDTQIKRAGFRIELADVEAALNSLPCVSEAAVVLREGSLSSSTELCCAFVPACGLSTTDREVRNALAELLPSYMLPTFWLCVEQLPRTPNGKTDRQRLKQQVQTLAESNLMTQLMPQLQDEEASAKILNGIADEYGTPCYVYFLEAIRRRICELRAAFGNRFHIRYAVKSNPSPSLLDCLRDQIDSLDVSSIGEVRLALNNGWSAGQLGFTGPAKRDDELAEAVAHGIGEIVVESVAEARRLNRLASAVGVRQDVVVRLTPARLPPGFGVRLAGRPTQFGIDEEEAMESIAAIFALPHLNVTGMHAFAGSQCLNPDSISAAHQIVADLFQRCATDLDFSPRTLVFGAGIGVASHEDEQAVDLDKVASQTNRHIDELKKVPRFRDTQFVLELGRYLVAEAGHFLTRVVAIKSSRGSLIGICDGGMNHHLAASGQFGSVMPRNYLMSNISRTNHNQTGLTCDLVGPLCTSIDRLAHSIDLPGLEVGDVIAIHASGAYGLSASPMHFIGHEPPKEVMVERIGGEPRFRDVSQFRNRDADRLRRKVA